MISPRKKEEIIHKIVNVPHRNNKFIFLFERIPRIIPSDFENLLRYYSNIDEQVANSIYKYQRLNLHATLYYFY